MVAVGGGVVAVVVVVVLLLVVIVRTCAEAVAAPAVNCFFVVAETRAISWTVALVLVLALVLGPGPTLVTDE